MVVVVVVSMLSLVCPFCWWCLLLARTKRFARILSEEHPPTESFKQMVSHKITLLPFHTDTHGHVRHAQIHARTLKPMSRTKFDSTFLWSDRNQLNFVRVVFSNFFFYFSFLVRPSHTFFFSRYNFCFSFYFRSYCLCQYTCFGCT